MKSNIHAALLCSALFLAATPLGAATFTPNVFDDPAPNSAPNGCTNAGPNPTRCSLREAALSSSANNETDTIVLGEGTYQLTIASLDTPETGDLDFVETGDGIYEITLQGAGSDKTIIDGSPSLNDRLVDIAGSDVEATLTGITFQNGNSSGSGGGVSFSSGASAGPDPITVTDCNFFNNKALNDTGGGLYISGSQPVVSIDGGIYRENQAILGGGLGLSHGGTNPAIDSVKNITLEDNIAVNGTGGGIYQSASIGVSFTNVRVIGNKATNPDNDGSGGYGGGIYSSNGSGTVNFALIDSVVSGNTADGNTSVNYGAGGFFAGGGALIRVINSTISDNEALNGKAAGGGYISNGGGIEILGSTFSGNQAGEGAGLYHTGAPGTINEITNSTFSGNQSSQDGGGVWMDHPAVSFNNVTFSNNEATGDGGAIFNGDPSTLILRNSIFAANASSGGTDDCGGGFFDSQGFNIFGSADDTNCQPDGFPVGNNPDDIVGDPVIGPLANNGGLTQTHALLEGSPAIDGGNPAGCEDGSGANLTTDQRGFERPTGAACDIGALEAAVADLQMVKTADSTAYIVGDEITYTLTVTNNGPDAAFALVSDTLPAGVSLIAADASCTESAGTLTCDLGSLDSGESASLEIVVEAGSEGTVTNTASVSGADIDPDPDNNSDSVSVEVIGEDIDGGGCNLGSSNHFESPMAWGIFGLGLAGAALLRRKTLIPNS